MTQFHRRHLRRVCCRFCLKRLGAPRWTYETSKQQRRWKRSGF